MPVCETRRRRGMLRDGTGGGNSRVFTTENMESTEANRTADRSFYGADNRASSVAPTALLRVLRGLRGEPRRFSLATPAQVVRITRREADARRAVGMWRSPGFPSPPRARRTLAGR